MLPRYLTKSAAPLHAALIVYSSDLVKVCAARLQIAFLNTIFYRLTICERLVAEVFEPLGFFSLGFARFFSDLVVKGEPGSDTNSR